MSRHILLIGLPGSGKSTVGKLVAEALGADVIDIDSLLVREMGKPVTQIFGMVGEARFREMERDAVNTAQARDPCVIVPGGPPMHLTATGSELRRALVLILHESSKPATSLAQDWKPKGLCRN